MKAVLESTVTGRGTAVVVLHGAPQDPSDLNTLSERLASVHRVHGLAMPGYGGSCLPVAFDWARASDAIAAYTHANCSRPWLVGMSAGGYRALRVAAQGIEVRGVCAIAGFAHMPASMRDGLLQSAAALESGADLSAALIGGWFSESFSTSHSARCDEVVGRCLSAAKPSVVAADLRALADAPDLRDDLSSVHAPIHLLTGALDAAAPVELARAAENSAPNATLTVLGGAGHMVHHEQFDAVYEWLSQSMDPREETS